MAVDGVDEGEDHGPMRSKGAFAGDRQRRWSRCAEEGISLVEVMVAMMILTMAMMGSLSLFEWAEGGMRQGETAMRALALAESKLERKRVVPWERLLAEDLDADGQYETSMRDDGLNGDVTAGDGVYTVRALHGPVELIWTVQPAQPRNPSASAYVVILVTARYRIMRDRWREIEVGTVRSNPRYVGAS